MFMVDSNKIGRIEWETGHLQRMKAIKMDTDIDIGKKVYCIWQ